MPERIYLRPEGPRFNISALRLYDACAGGRHRYNARYLDAITYCAAARRQPRERRLRRCLTYLLSCKGARRRHLPVSSRYRSHSLTRIRLSDAVVRKRTVLATA